MKHSAEYDYSPFRIILVTTGFSNVVDFLFHNKNIYLVGIMECRYSENNCNEYARKNQIIHCFYKDFYQMAEWVGTLQADLMITYKVSFLIPQSIFDKPRYGTINIHPSLLPQYRGANPWFWIYYYMESKGGVTIHKVDEYEDHGDILAQESFPIVLGFPLYLLQQEAEKVAINLLHQLFANWETIKAIPQKSNSKLIHTKKYVDLEKLSDLISIDGIRLWHILRGFPFLLKKIYPELEGEYIIGDFMDVHEQDKVGNILYKTEGLYLICCNGSIQIFRK